MLLPITDFSLMQSSPNALCLSWWEIVGTYILKFGCLPVALRHVQMLKRAATSFILSSMVY